MAVKVEVMRSCVIPYFFMRPFTDFFHFFQRTGPFFSSSTGYMCFYDMGFLLSM